MTLKLLGESLFFFRTHLLRILTLVLPVIVPLEIAKTWLLGAMIEATPGEPMGGQAGLVFAMHVIFYPLYMAALVFFIADCLNDKQRPWLQYYQAALSRWFSMFMLIIITGLLSALGFMALVLPGILIACRLGFANFHCILESQGVIQSISSSWKKTGPYFWTLFQGYAIILLVMLIGPQLMAELLVATGADGFISQALMSVVWSVIAIFTLIFSFRVYCLQFNEEPTASE